MKSLRKVTSALLTGLLAAAGMTVASGSASATSVVVPPGGTGHVCSPYHSVTSQHYWQTCTWADPHNVWFTVNFGNSGDANWYPDWTQVDYIKSAAKLDCWKGRWEGPALEIEGHSTLGTPRLNCVVTRVPGAFASRARVTLQNADQEIVDDTSMNSPTLQVQ